MNTIYNELKAALDISCSTQNDDEIQNVLTAYEFDKENVSKGMTCAIKYTKSDLEGFKITVDYRSVDPSGPFQNIPDINKYNLILEQNGTIIESYSNEYSD